MIDGVVAGRNTGRGTAIYDLQPFIGKRITLVPERVHANLRAEVFNVLNHRNVVGFSGTWETVRLRGTDSARRWRGSRTS